MLPIEANELDLTNFHPVLAEYGPKGIYAPSALVTHDNIGQIALELEEDVVYSDLSCTLPYIKILATRHEDDPIELTIKPGFWIVLVWDEIHLFKDELFQKTFKVAVSSEPEGMSEEAYQEMVRVALEEEREKRAAEHIGDPNPPRVGPDYHAGSLYKSEGQDPEFYDREAEEQRIMRQEEKTVIEEQIRIDSNPLDYGQEEQKFIRLRDKTSGNVVISTIEAWQDMVPEAKALFEEVDAETQFIPQVSIPIMPATSGELTEAEKAGVHRPLDEV